MNKTKHEHREMADILKKKKMGNAKAKSMTDIAFNRRHEVSSRLHVIPVTTPEK